MLSIMDKVKNGLSLHSLCIRTSNFEAEVERSYLFLII